MRLCPLNIHAFRVLVLGLFFLSFPNFTLASSFQAKVIHVADGDTITVLNDAKEQIKIRVNGIDCPEKGQAFGKKAKQFTKDLVAGEMVMIQPYKHDKYGRTIGDVILGDGRHLSQELVRAGFAWWFFKYSDDAQLGQLEVEAKIAKVGLWKDRNPIPPWIYRHRSKLLSQDAPVPTPHRAPSQIGQTLPFLARENSRQ